jgi:hypothetical protein
MFEPNNYFTVKCKTNESIDIHFQSESDATTAIQNFDGKYLNLNNCGYWVGEGILKEDLYVAPISRKTITFEDALNGVKFERRKYGRSQFFCWAHIPKADGGYFSCGDPYPAAHFKKSVLHEVIESVMRSHRDYFEA